MNGPSGRWLVRVARCALNVGGFAGFLLAAVYGTALLMSGHATRKHQIPFGPFMIVGAFLVILAWHL
jgi:prepilin signal peptidase PulO-like enzyme (type II secretory pathway)